MEREYYDPSTGQIWATNDHPDPAQRYFRYVREANPWERPGYQAQHQPPGPPEYFSAPAPAAAAPAREYPERRADGSIWEVTHWSDGSSTDRMVQGPPAPAVSPPAPAAGPPAPAVSPPAPAAGPPPPAPGAGAAGAGGTYGINPALYDPAFHTALLETERERLRRLQIPQFQESIRQFNEQQTFERARQQFREQMEQQAAARATAGLTGFYGGTPTFEREQYLSRLQANPRDYVEYFRAARPGQPIPVPAFAQALAAGQGLERPTTAGLSAAPTGFFLRPGDVTPRAQQNLLPSERGALESLISAQGEQPADFFARGRQLFPFGSVTPSPRFRVF